jgi:hypothetical protein
VPVAKRRRLHAHYFSLRATTDQCRKRGAAPAPPRITPQPDAVKAAAGQAETFTAKVAALPAPTFQWFKNGTAISGATSATLKLDSVRPADAGSYTVTPANASGAATSEKATLTVN